MSYNNSLREMQYQLGKLRQGLADYRLSGSPSPYYISSQEKLITSIQEYIYESESQVRLFEATVSEISYTNKQENVTLIKKMGLLIAISGLQYPTINQSLQTIYDAYLASEGRVNELRPELYSDNLIHVTFPVI